MQNRSLLGPYTSPVPIRTSTLRTDIYQANTCTENSKDPAFNSQILVHIYRECYYLPQNYGICFLLYFLAYAEFLKHV